jgi:hypothetical protein
MMNSITSLLEFARSNPLGRREDDNKNNPTDSSTNINAAARLPPSPGPYDLPETMAAAPIPSTLRNLKSATAGGPMKKRSAGAKHKAPSKQQAGNKAKKPRRIIPDNKEYIPENEQPSDADVVGGRGGRSNHHAGNRPYWIKILGSRYHYRTCQSDAAKTVIAQDILNYIKIDKGGRFLNLDSKTNRWFVLPDAVVLDKIKQALRDKYVPFWAKNMDIPTLPPGGVSSISRAAAASNINNMLGTSSSDNTMKWANSSNLSSSKSSKLDDGNKLGFLLSASRAAAANPSMAAIPTMDDALKCKIDTLPTFGQGTTANNNDSRMSFSFASGAGYPGGAMGGTSNASLGMGMFHSVHNANLLASMASLGGGGGVSHGFGVGGNSGAPSLGGGGLPPPYSTAVAAGSLFNSAGLQSADLERFLESSKMSGGAKSVDLLQSLTGGGMASLGSLGAVSFGLPDSLGAASAVTAAAGEGNKMSSSPVPPGSSKSKSKKTDWNAMFKTALKKEEV